MFLHPYHQRSKTARQLWELRLTSLPASHAQNTAKCSQHGSLPGLPPLSTSTSQISQRLPPESREILRASEIGGLLKPVPVSTLETCRDVPRPSREWPGAGLGTGWFHRHGRSHSGGAWIFVHNTILAIPILLICVSRQFDIMSRG